MNQACPVSEKHALRRELLTLRKAISQKDKQAWDAALNRAITEHVWFQQAEELLAYYPIGSEPDIRPALEAALLQGKRVYLPRCDPETRGMAFHRIASLEGLRPAAHGIPAPEKENCQLSFFNGQICLVPGVAFDETGIRLGYGGGYYDRFLAQYGHLKTLGICYGMLLRDCLPNGAMDIAVKRVLTEKDGLQA